MKRLILLAIITILIYPSISKADDVKIQKFECKVSESINDIKNLDIVKNMIELEELYKIKYKMAPLRVLLIPSRTDGMELKISVSGQPETASIFTWANDHSYQQDGVDYYLFVNITSGDIFTISLDTGTAYYLRNDNYVFYKCTKQT